ncbi:phage integrase central domain-containing protein [Streptomyces hygroscopicus]|uniref:phage integrase central domain-containing protein n=1 Tax=Streptomyces hygroscopicus TaxID=1912 RepID=UPI0037B6C9BF
MARAWVARSKDDPKKWTTYWYDPDGKQRQKTFETKKRADDQRKRKEQELDAGISLDDRLGKQPVTAVWEQWTNHRKLENSTKKQYRSILNTTIEPFFKARSIVSLKVADVEQWLLWMEQDRKLSARTRRQRFSFFSGMMDWAVVNEIVGRNPCKKVKGAGSRAKEIREQKSTARRLTTREVLTPALLRVAAAVRRSSRERCGRLDGPQQYGRAEGALPLHLRRGRAARSGRHRNDVDAQRRRPDGGIRGRLMRVRQQPPARRRGLCCLCRSVAVFSPASAQDSPSMTPRNGPDRAATGRKPRVSPRTFETASDLQKPC